MQRLCPKNKLNINGSNYSNTFSYIPAIFDNFYMLRKRKRSESSPAASRSTRHRRVLDDGDSTVPETASGSTKTLTAPKTPVTGRRSTRKKTIASGNQDVTMTTRSRKTVLPGSPRVSDAENAVDPPKPKSKRAASTRLATEPETHSTRSRAKKSIPLIQSPNDTVTPESSPIPVNLTPHRSLKTPKKSPLSLGSPKTHSKSPLRASRTPRKLTVLVESPDDMFAETPIQLGSKIESSPVDIGKNVESESPPTFVSSLEVQLGTSRERKLSGSSSNSTLVSRDSSTNTSSSKIKSPQKLRVLGSKLRKSPVKTPVSKIGASPHNNGVCTPPNAGRSRPFDPESPKRLRSTAKKISAAKRSQGDETTAFILGKVNALLEPNVSSLSATPRGRIKRSLHLTPDFTNFSGVQTSSPIPTKQKTGINLPSVLRRREPEDGSMELVDGANFLEASGNTSDQKEKDGTYEISEKKESHNATYELAEPKTPKLRQKARKRSLSQVETSHCTPEAKKRCRVRFATPEQEQRVRYSADTPGSARKSLPATNTPGKQKLGTRSTIGSITSRRRSRSVTKIDEKTPSARAAAKRRSNSASAFPDRTPGLSQSIQSSVNRLSRPRQVVNSEAKSEVKVPVPTKIPNFAQIHQKKFEKMESLVDAKKRVAKRHEELSTAQIVQSSPLASTASTSSSASSAKSETVAPEKENLPPSETEKINYNRFGFKTRKDEARQIIARKTAAPPSARNHVSSNRTMLKDVRVNRRFELLMKFRNSKKG